MALHCQSTPAQRLRLAQADDALDDIRRYRRIITGIKEFNRLNISGTGQRTTGKVRSVYSTFQSKIDRAAERYRAARTALLALDHTGGWQERLKELRGEDIRGPGRPDDEDPTGDGRFIVSWIWLVPRVSGESPVGCEDINVTEVLDNMKYEWSRSKARAERWTEEVALLEEEMRRIVEFFEWKARWWREQATRRGDVSAELATGLAIYAEKQACVFEGLAMRCVTSWLPYMGNRPGKDVPLWLQQRAPQIQGDSSNAETTRMGLDEDAAWLESSADES
ncbi:uncharacterized protein BXZ73DRAFT_82990 [Epithele typhae]|uniref:uncharacterized protein n=1 Tax=Epithele typhae TaxID=378194 RepID=UPI002007F9C8|nr:uncharacterized protein BXZ73DRAFT_82990 [Epithele typhae]KAH9911104.1 hypothetical protein BXZ73DRAFT_82990 [Epithele typhae]